METISKILGHQLNIYDFVTVLILIVTLLTFLYLALDRADRRYKKELNRLDD